MYIDGGTGSMLLQAAAALVFSCLIFFKQIVVWMKNLARGEESDEKHE